MGLVVALLVIVALAFLIIRVGAVALERTGLSHDAARFQALSAFFGAGFTTGESELVVNHPVRRKIIRDLIIVGNIGVISLLTTSVASAAFAGGGASLAQRAAVAAAGLLALYILSRSPLLMRVIDFTIERALDRTSVVRAMDYEKLLRTHAGYGIAEVLVEAGSPLAGRALAASRPRDKGVSVLGIARAGGGYDASPGSETVVNEGDTLLVYGPDLFCTVAGSISSSGFPWNHCRSFVVADNAQKDASVPWGIVGSEPDPPRVHRIHAVC